MLGYRSGQSDATGIKDSREFPIPKIVNPLLLTGFLTHRSFFLISLFSFDASHKQIDSIETHLPLRTFHNQEHKG